MTSQHDLEGADPFEGGGVPNAETMLTLHVISFRPNLPITSLKHIKAA